MWPQIPENLSSLTASELRALARSIREHAQSVLAASPTGEQVTEVNQYMAQRAAIVAEADRQDEIARLSAEADDATGEEVIPEPEPVAEETPETPEPEPEATPDPEPELVTASAVPARTSIGVPARPETTEAPLRTAPEYLLARDGIQGVAAGQGFESWRQLAEAAVKVGSSIRPGSSTKHELAVIRGNYPEERRLTEDVVFNLDRFEPDELTAALCAPATPYYNLACANTLRRPVFASLPQFAAPRGKVSIYPSPSLSDITTGYGQWTHVDDADNDAVKEACQTIACASPTEYTMYGVYRCLTVKNMLAMTFPELVEAYLNRLGAAHARLAEQLLLEAMESEALDVAAPALGYGGSVTVTSTILNLLALWQEQERWDLGTMEAWLPRWVMYAMKMDIMRRRNSSGANVGVPSDSTINGMFRDVGVNPNWYIDTPAWATPVPAVRQGGVLNLLPRTLEVLVAPAGKYAVIDRGELAIGVTGNNIYRDNVSNSRNEFTFFFENFEGVVNTTSCPAYKLEIEACWNGIQIDDVVIDCEGNDYTNVGSGS